MLPGVSAGAAAALVLAAMTPALVRLWRRPRAAEFADAAAFACLCGFVFGYHVHEKAILMVRLTLTAAQRELCSRSYRAERGSNVQVAGYFGFSVARV